MGKIVNHIESPRLNDEFSSFFAKIYEREIVSQQPIQTCGGITLSVKNVTFVLTQDCNLKCTYCYECGKNKDSDMTFEVAKKFIDLLFDEYKKVPYSKFINPDNSKAIILDMMGGEPLMRIDLIEEIYDYFLWRSINEDHPWALHHRISISTNGLLYLSPRVQDFLKRHPNSVSIGITLDGNKELHDSCRLRLDGTGSYDIVIEAVKEHIKTNPTYSSKLTIAPANIEYLPSAVFHMMDIGMKNIAANCVYEEGWEPHHGRIFYYKLKEIADHMLDNKIYDVSNRLFELTLGKGLAQEDNKNWCGGTGAMLAVDSRGDIYPCVRYMPFTLVNAKERGQKILGTVDKGFFHNEKAIQIFTELEDITRRSQSTDECFNCPISEGCSWCSAYNFDVNGTPNKRATFICPTHKGRVMANCYFWNKYFMDTEDPDRIFENNIPFEWAKGIGLEEEYHELNKLIEERKAQIEELKKR